MIESMNTIEHRLEDSGLRWAYDSFSALDRYFGIKDASVVHIIIEGTLIDLAKTVPEITFPGLAGIEAIAYQNERSYLFRCVDEMDRPPLGPYSVLDFTYEPGRGCYRDPRDSYHDLRETMLRETEAFEPGWESLSAAAILVSRYRYRLPETWPASESIAPDDPIDAQRLLLTRILSGNLPWNGLSLLRREGYVERHWPELERLDGVFHAKEYHPEGNVWEHTLETFRYRKTTDLVLSLALLLHDSGKPVAAPAHGRQFDRHAELGTRIARQFLGRLRFPEQVIREVEYLVDHHMMPGAIGQLPLVRSEPVMSSPLFPVLLELYRCDLSSTWRGPDGYYEACQVYKQYLRNRRNPFRGSDGKKLLRLYVE